MSFHFSDVTVKQWLRLFGPFLVLILIGFLGRSLYPNYWWRSDLVFGLFDALAIAGLVGVGLELYSTKFLIERVADDLTEKLVGRGLPNKLQSHIRDITETDIVREEFVKTYSFGEPHEGRVVLDIEMAFSARNFSDSGVMYAPELQEESVYSPEFVYLEYGIVGRLPHVFNAATCKVFLKQTRNRNLEASKERRRCAYKRRKMYARLDGVTE